MPIKSLINLFRGKPKMSKQEVASMCELFLSAEAEAIQRLKLGHENVAVIQAVNANEMYKRLKEMGITVPPHEVPHPGPQPHLQRRASDEQWMCDKELHDFAECIRSKIAIQSSFERQASSYLFFVKRLHEAQHAEHEWKMMLTHWRTSLPQLAAKQYTLIALATSLGLEKPNRHTVERRALADLLIDTGWEKVQRGKRVLYQHPDYSPN